MLKFGHRAEPFVDDYLIDSLENVSFRITKPENLGKVLAFDKPWEDLGSLVGTVIQTRMASSSITADSLPAFPAMLLSFKPLAWPKAPTESISPAQPSTRSITSEVGKTTLS